MGSTMIREFAYATEDDNIIKSISTMEVFYKKYKNRINRSEWEDFQQDIILYTLQMYKKYDASRGSFNTYLGNTFIGLLSHMVTRYTGIKVTQNDFKKNPKLVIRLVEYENKDNFKGED